ncbi:MAG: hypothetical protein J7K45_00285 [Thaumarchaeota archaeon]|nr:hypothetical protein [Nitrososphaerota archaeon]
MSTTVIAEGIVAISIIIASSMLAASLTSSFQLVNQKYMDMVSSYEERISVATEILMVSGESGGNVVRVWIKNVGVKGIDKGLIRGSSLFFGNGSGYRLIPYNSSTPPSWNYTIANDLDGDGNWDPFETLEVTITLDYNLEGGEEYKVTFYPYTGRNGDTEVLSL